MGCEMIRQGREEGSNDRMCQAAAWISRAWRCTAAASLGFEMQSSGKDTYWKVMSGEATAMESQAIPRRGIG